MAKAALEGFATDWRRLKGGRFVAVDCDPSAAQLTLSHHFGGNGTPIEFRHDLASGAALAWAASPSRDDYLGKARFVYNDHFDVDGFLAAWVVLHPDEALSLKEEVMAAASAGDFEEWTGDRAVKFAIAGEWIDDPAFSQVAREALETKDKSTGDALYEAVMAQLPELLRRPETVEALWRRPYRALERQVELFEQGAARVHERPARSLSIVRAPRLLQTRAIVARSKGDRLLQAAEVDGGWMYQFRYRPYLGYRIVSRRTSPVHDLDVLARELNERWPTPGEAWRPRGWWNRELRLYAAPAGRRRIPKTAPEAAASAFEQAFEALDARDPSARSPDS